MLTSPSIRSELDRARLADRRRRDDIPAGHAAVIDTVFRHLRPVVNELGTSLFDNAPDVLLAMAEDMDGGPEQRLYFEAIRTLKSIRGPVYLVFKTTLLGRVRAQHVDAPGAPAEPELSLRDDDSLEEVIAISNIVQDIEASHGQQLYEMECRLQAAVRAGVPLEPASLMPIGIVEAFNTALADVDVTPKIKLVMFRLFSHFIAQRLDEFLGAVITAPRNSSRRCAMKCENSRNITSLIFGVTSTSASAVLKASTMPIGISEAGSRGTPARTAACSRHSISYNCWPWLASMSCTMLEIAMTSSSESSSRRLSSGSAGAPGASTCWARTRPSSVVLNTR